MLDMRVFIIFFKMKLTWCEILVDFYPKKHTARRVFDGQWHGWYFAQRPNPDNPGNVSYLNRDSHEWYENWNDLENDWNRNELVLRRRMLLHRTSPLRF